MEMEEAVERLQGAIKLSDLGIDPLLVSADNFKITIGDMELIMISESFAPKTGNTHPSWITTMTFRDFCIRIKNKSFALIFHSNNINPELARSYSDMARLITAARRMFELHSLGATDISQSIELQLLSRDFNRIEFQDLEGIAMDYLDYLDEIMPPIYVTSIDMGDADGDTIVYSTYNSRDGP